MPRKAFSEIRRSLKERVKEGNREGSWPLFLSPVLGRGSEESDTGCKVKECSQKTSEETHLHGGMHPILYRPPVYRHGGPSIASLPAAEELSEW